MSIRYGLAAFLALICLAACGGGGGGGGGVGGGGAGVKGIPLSTFAGGGTPVGKANNLSEAIGPGPAAGLTTPNPSGGVNGFKRELDNSLTSSLGLYWSTDSVSLSIVGQNNIKATSPQGTSFITAKDMTIFNNGLVGVIVDEYSEKLTPGNTGVPGISGNIAASEVVMLGGKAVGLEYTNFGFWEVRARATGKLNGDNIDYAINGYTPFILESTRAKTVKPPSSGTFRGTVVANAYDRANLNTSLEGKVVSLVGTANLDLSSATSGSMVFSFNNFYTMTTPLTISGNGAISSSSFTISDPGKNKTGIILPSSGMSPSFGGQFYGNSVASEATEAVGTFGYNNSAHTTGVNGSWGVKK